MSEAGWRLSPFLRVPLVAGLTRDSLLKMDPETAHGATITALRLGLAPQQDGADAPELKTSMAGLELSNPVGMAAGSANDALRTFGSRAAPGECKRRKTGLGFARAWHD